MVRDGEIISRYFWEIGRPLPELEKAGCSGFVTPEIGLQAMEELGWELPPDEDATETDIVFWWMSGRWRCGAGSLYFWMPAMYRLMCILGRPSGHVPSPVRVFRPRPLGDPSKACHGPCWICGECPA